MGILSIPPVDLATGLGIAGAGVWAMHSQWGMLAPKMSALRTSSGDNVVMHQQLSDATWTVGGLVILGGGIASYACRSLLPLLILAAALGFLWYTHRSALTGGTPQTGDDDGDDS